MINKEDDPTNELDAVTTEHLEVTGEDDGELTEELADTAVIEQLLDTFVGEVGDILDLAVEVSMEGNPVRTHLDLVTARQDIVELAQELKQELISKVAVRAEEIAEQGLNLRKQVIEEQES
jgi:hypothetical protein